MSGHASLGPDRSGPLRVGFVGLSVASMLALVGVSWSYVVLAEDSGFRELVTGESWEAAWAFLRELAGVGGGQTPAYLRLDRWIETAGLAYETLAMSVLATGVAAAGAVLTVLPAARTMAWGDAALSSSLPWRALFFVVRGLYVFTRGIPELVWAMLLVFFLNPGALVGALALAVHNFGILGKLAAEVIEDADPRPLRSLRGTGARGLQMVAYGVLPQVLPQLLTYTLYRWEVIIRTSIVVGFVGAGGLGRDFRLHMSWFQYTDVVLLLLWYLMLVLAVDLTATWFRRLAR